MSVEKDGYKGEEQTRQLKRRERKMRKAKEAVHGIWTMKVVEEVEL